jgi:lysophospholipase L1-like esterase
VRIQNLIRGALKCAFIVHLFFWTVLGTASGEPIRVEATGDSITCMYWSALPQAFNALGVAATVPDPVHTHAGSINTAREGMNTSAYTGVSGGWGEPSYSYVNNVSVANPSAILFMLGINDMGWDSNIDARFNTYKTNVTSVFDNFANITNSQGLHPKVIIGSILPYNVAVEEAYLTNTYHTPYVHQFNVMENLAAWNAWLHQKADQYGFDYLDNFTAMQQISNWDTTLIGIDGLHPTDDGVNWIASRYAGATVVPEPSTLFLLGMGLIGLLSWQKRKPG